MKNKKMLMIFTAFFIGLTGIIYSVKDDDSGDKTVAYEDNTLSITDEQKETEDDTICVYVCGFVNSPGVYNMSSGERIADAIIAAGGMSEDADVNYLNQALKLTDGLKIYVPGKDETAEDFVPEEIQINDGSTGLVQDGKVNINTADKDELMSLSGIGESRALAIIEYREQNGFFKNIEDIMNVSGIKDAMFEKICDYITV